MLIQVCNVRVQIEPLWW